MKALKTILTLNLMFLILPAMAETPEDRGLAIAREMEKRNDGFGDSRVDLRMVLQNRHGQSSERALRIRTLEVKDDGDKNLTICDTPKDIKGTAFLTYSHKKDDDDQWLFLPALKRVKRISSRQKSGSFMGSEFAYEDFSSPELEKYTYKWLRDEAWAGSACHVIEKYPIDQRYSGYKRQVVWVDTKEFRLQKAVFYDRKGALLKTLMANDYRKYQDRFWRAHEMNMVNHQTGKSTTLTFTNYRFLTGLNDLDFSKNSLKRIR
ncbi:outer membrane lipoprotein-sorting protein [bacterium M21]|nr:outer membrane lipoprotein-sorting protein [bacterium M21]